MLQTLIDWFPAFIIISMTLALMFWHDGSGLVALILMGLGRSGTVRLSPGSRYSPFQPRSTTGSA
ncbi:MAG TPA: hypothetical protein VF498_10410, partial [Anaerolineales bacterium]